jgi:hypothetical protein
LHGTSPSIISRQQAGVDDRSRSEAGVIRLPTYRDGARGERTQRTKLSLTYTSLGAIAIRACREEQGQLIEGNGELQVECGDRTDI